MPSDPLACLSNCLDLRVSGWIPTRDNFVPTTPDNLLTFDDHRPKWTAGSGIDPVNRQLDNLPHDRLIHAQRLLLV